MIDERTFKVGKVFPAHAGVIPHVHPMQRRSQGFARTRGGDPEEFKAWVEDNKFFPHTRG